MPEAEQLDRISSLPDALLSEILSFLSTKQAVATSILSKRWVSVWTKVPVLNFSLFYDSSKDFKAFVDRVLICNDSRSLRLFRIIVIFYKKINDYHYHQRIRNIMQRDVVEIDIVLQGGTLPAGTFSSEKLMVLKLKGFDSPLRDPFHLPNLVTLHFSFIKFADDFSLKNIVMRLPRLEELVISECKVLRNICIRSSSLKRLSLIRNIFSMGENDSNIIVAAPSLEYLCIDGYSPHYEFGNMPSIAEARLQIRYCKGDYYVKVLKFLKQVPNLKFSKFFCLYLSDGLSIFVFRLMNSKATIGDTEHDQQPLFPHLTRLIISGYDFGSADSSKILRRHLVLWILQRAPNLVSLDYSVFKINLKGMVSGTTIAAIAGLFKVPRASSIGSTAICYGKLLKQEDYDCMKVWASDHIFISSPN
ncbi:F-box/FBD/LRR-repeat protein At5g56420-like [Chenopodium quinoa]|uniref:F-box/FBD/LRR-repeat protein At5g56420-like n=1 Tax=Chenopodium quinoa TaxID=63459 RepID=UPI000B7761BB|nr:F-box/FBD/LRR-repeat protein At5g56420-like [Chenopodium quinoa]